MKRKVLAYYGPTGRYRAARINTSRGYVILDVRTGRTIGPMHPSLLTAIATARSLSRAPPATADRRTKEPAPLMGAGSFVSRA